MNDKKYQIMVCGAQFNNKGAQSLLFSLIDQLSQTGLDYDVIYLPLDDSQKYSKSDYKMKIVDYSLSSRQYAFDSKCRLKFKVKNALRCLIGRKKQIDVAEFYRCMPKMDLLIDISGYQLSSVWPDQVNDRYLSTIQFAKKYNVPVVLMPQSFGPFEYSSKKKLWVDRISKVLNCVDLIYARELQSKQALLSIGVQNVHLSCDLVLQNKRKIDLTNIYQNLNDIKEYRRFQEPVVGIIPNFQIFKYADTNMVLEFYLKVIRLINDSGRKAVIFRHSSDLDVCRLIHDNAIKENMNVELYEQDMDCLEYEMFINQFDFLVASRFHAIVHAYKNNIPCIVLGWADKYLELMRLFKQEKYLIDSRCVFDFEIIFSIVNTMIKNYCLESELIEECFKSITDKECVTEAISLLK